MTCPQCEGRGTQPCEKTDADGVDYDEEPCEGCLGAGEVPNDECLHWVPFFPPRFSRGEYDADGEGT